MSSPEIAVVENFIAAMNRGEFEAAFELMAEDIEYHNMPFDPLFGREAAKQAIEAFGVEKCDWITHHISAANGVVLTERTDRVRVAQKWIEIPLMGMFRIVDGKIALWRDYFDPATLS